MNIKKNILFRALALVLMAAFIFTAVPSVAMTAKAADETTDSIPSKVRIYPYFVDNYAIEIGLVDSGYKLKNLKSNDSNLKVYNTGKTNSTYSGYKTEFDIGCYARKPGKYKVSFTLVKGSKKLKKTVTVFAKADEPIKKVTFAGKRIDSYIDYDYAGRMGFPDSGAFSVKMRKGYKLVGINVKTYLHSTNTYSESTYTNSSYVDKAISNGDTVSLSDVAYKYYYKYQENETFEENMVAETVFEITYKDKYTKEEVTTQYSLYKLVNFEK